MQRAATFFGGVCLGGILAAACGFDLFRRESESGEKALLANLDVEARQARALVNESKSLLREYESRIAALSEKLQHKDVELSSLRSGPPPSMGGIAARASASEAQARAESTGLKAELARLSQEVEVARKGREAAQAEAARWEGLLRDQILRFFARERDDADATIASEYLARSPNKESIQELILALIQRNKPILMSLPHDPAGEGGLGAAKGDVVPASAHEKGELAPQGSSAR